MTPLGRAAMMAAVKAAMLAWMASGSKETLPSPACTTPPLSALQKANRGWQGNQKGRAGGQVGKAAAGRCQQPGQVHGGKMAYQGQECGGVVAPALALTQPAQTFSGPHSEHCFGAASLPTPSLPMQGSRKPRTLPPPRVLPTLLSLPSWLSLPCHIPRESVPRLSFFSNRTPVGRSLPHLKSTHLS